MSTHIRKRMVYSSIIIWGDKEFFICPLAQNACHGLKLRYFKLRRTRIKLDILKDTRGWSRQIWWVNRKLFWLQWFRASLLSYQIQNPSIFKTCWWKVQNLTICQKTFVSNLLFWGGMKNYIIHFIFRKERLVFKTGPIIRSLMILYDLLAVWR